MGRKMDDVIAALPAERREKIELRANALASEMIQASLKDLRQSVSKTQADVAKKMGMAQNAVSQLEKRADVRLSTIGRYAKAIGGKVAVIIEMPGGKQFAVARIASTGQLAAFSSALPTATAAAAPNRLRAGKGSAAGPAARKSKRPSGIS